MRFIQRFFAFHISLNFHSVVVFAFFSHSFAFNYLFICILHSIPLIFNLQSSVFHSAFLRFSSLHFLFSMPLFLLQNSPEFHFTFYSSLVWISFNIPMHLNQHLCTSSWGPFSIIYCILIGIPLLFGIVLLLFIHLYEIVIDESIACTQRC